MHRGGRQRRHHRDHEPAQLHCFVRLLVRAGYRVRFATSRTLDFFGEVFNVTNRANFNNPTGDRRSGNFLVPVSLRGGGFPRQIQFGARLGF